MSKDKSFEEVIEHLLKNKKYPEGKKVVALSLEDIWDYQQEKVEKRESLLKLAIKDLVRISIKANNVIIKGSFSGKDSDEVKEVLDICNHVVSTFSGSDHEEE